MWRGQVGVGLIALVAVACGGDDGEGGGSFAPVTDVPEVQAYGAVWSFAADDVYVSAESGRVLHYDGSGWDETQLDTYEMMVGAWALDRDNLWMVGGSTLAHYDGSAWTLTDFSQENAGIDGLTAVWASAPNDLWVVGTQSTAAHWDGSAWQRHIAAGTENHAVWGSGPNDVYVLGNFEVAHWDGSSFSELELDLFSGEGVWGFGPDDVWITDGEGTMAHFDGQDWQVSELDTLSGPSALWGLAADDIWGVGSFATISRYDGRGWREISKQAIGSPYLRVFNRVHGSEDGDVWIIGSELGEQGAKPLLLRQGR